MGIVQDSIDRLRQLQSDREPWEKHWYDIARYTLPDAERFDGTFAHRERSTAIDSVVSTPIASQRGREIYDMTSLWAVDRGAAGTLSLVTPQTETWHDLRTDDPFAGEPSDEESRWYERLRDYLFETRADPASGFWMMHKAGMRAVWAFGTSVGFIEESRRGIEAPISYRYVPLSECHLATNFEGVVDTNYRLFTRSAKQCVEKWGDKCSAKVKQMAESAKDKDHVVTILHAVYPRAEKGSIGNTNRNSTFASCYIEVEEKYLIGESGYFEFPFRVDHWQRNNPGPYAEGPVSLALAEIKSLNMMSKNQLIAMQQWTRPPLATIDDGLTRLDLNAGAVNPGYVNQSGQLLAQPIVTAQRPDLAEQVLEAKRNQIRETLYVNLWQILISNPQMTATEAMIRANEKGDLLGPVGSSIQTGLSQMVDREISVLARRGAFEPGSPLSPPESLQGRTIGVRFTSPLDRLRRLPEFQGMQQLITFAASIAEIKPEVLDKFDEDTMVDEAQEILGAPRKIMATDDLLAQRRQQRQAQQSAQAGIAAAAGAGQAAVASAEGAQAVADSPAASAILERIAGVAGVAAE